MYPQHYNKFIIYYLIVKLYNKIFYLNKGTIWFGGEANRLCDIDIH